VPKHACSGFGRPAGRPCPTAPLGRGADNGVEAEPGGAVHEGRARGYGCEGGMARRARAAGRARAARQGEHARGVRERVATGHAWRTLRLAGECAASGPRGWQGERATSVRAG
jgi:hypothetical protein